MAWCGPLWAEPDAGAATTAAAASAPASTAARRRTFIPLGPLTARRRFSGRFQSGKLAPMAISAINLYSGALVDRALQAVDVTGRTTAAATTCAQPQGCP